MTVRVADAEPGMTQEGGVKLKHCVPLSAGTEVEPAIKHQPFHRFIQPRALAQMCISQSLFNIPSANTFSVTSNLSHPGYTRERE